MVFVILLHIWLKRIKRFHESILMLQVSSPSLLLQKLWPCGQRINFLDWCYKNGVRKLFYFSLRVISFHWDTLYTSITVSLNIHQRISKWMHLIRWLSSSWCPQYPKVCLWSWFSIWGVERIWLLQGQVHKVCVADLPCHNGLEKLCLSAPFPNPWDCTDLPLSQIFMKTKFSLC
jgi:hypothetical protein